MLLRKNVLEGIERGDIDVAFRRWTRPTVRSGGTLRTPIGLIHIGEVRPVSVGEITEDEARRAGVPLEELLGFLNAKQDGEVYRVELTGVGPDPRVTLRQDDQLSPEDVEMLVVCLDRLDRASKRGPWTREFLRLLAGNPHVRAQDLADGLGLDKPVFKNDVRKLKELGLTISHSPGYEVSPRGLALLQVLEAD